MLSDAVATISRLADRRRHSARFLASIGMDASSTAGNYPGERAGYGFYAARIAGPATGHWAEAAILICALFLQRFTLTFGESLMSLNIVPIALIIAMEIVRGRLRVQPARLFWFFAVWSAAACSLVLNFDPEMLPSFALFSCLYGFFTVARSTQPRDYARTLEAFQTIVAVLSLIAIAQFCLQFVLDGEELMRFYGVFPDFLFTDRFNTVIHLYEGSSLIKSNGLFLLEPSSLSGTAALAILVELSVFGRLSHVFLFVTAMLLAYSGTGLVVLLTFLPFVLHNRGSRLALMTAMAFVFAIFAMGFVDASVFLSRLDEFTDITSSGFMRFVAPVWLLRDYLVGATPLSLLFGNGPGTADAFTGGTWYPVISVTWLKLFYEYGIVGSCLFVCFLISCFKRSACPPVLLGAIIFGYSLLGGLLLNTSALAMTIVLCTAQVRVMGRRESEEHGQAAPQPQGCGL